MVKIRPITADDFPNWLPLWDGNNNGQRDQEITTETWARLTDPAFPVHGIVAEKNGELVGLVQYVLHYTTGHIEPICYMQDVYVPPEQRQQGIARKMVEHLAKVGKEQKWPRMYWLAESDNEAAQKLYKTLGVKLDFTLHVLVP
ncbi:MAG: GNAT family N-acetyltransferase [Pseudomonadota bacterium]